MKNGIVTLLLLGAGGRGTIYARFAARMPDKARIVGVAEPREFFRQRIVHENAVPPEHVFSDWKEAARRPRFADAVVISTLDGTHEEMAVTFASLGYHILIEKPLALTPEDCLTIADAVRRNGVILSVCHVMRYAQYTEKMRQLISSGRLGALISVRHAEPVGFWRYAHSYVRGNWRKEEDSSCLLLAKSICEPAHLHIWDEPMNYIDVISRMQLEQLLLQFHPTILFVEHDKAFCEKIATKIVKLSAL